MLKTRYNTDKTELENEIPDTSDLVKKQITILKSLTYRVKSLILVI